VATVEETCIPRAYRRKLVAANLAQLCYQLLSYGSNQRGLNMTQTQLATRIDATVKKAVETVCQIKGLKMNRFIEEALIDKLEEIDDIEDLKKIRFEKSRPLADVLKDLKLDGKI
jgi:hypothetical protein